MKRIVLMVLAVMMMATGTAIAGPTYYCLPKDDGYFCKPVDFEIRTFNKYEKDCPKNTACLYEAQNYKCTNYSRVYAENGWSCVPFDKGAILLEPPRDCDCQRNNWYVNTPGVTLN